MSITYPKRIIEDVLFKVDKFIFLADFVILNCEEDREVPLILGCPFLATRRTLIDVQNRELTIRVNDQEVKFNLFNTIKFPNEVEDCYLVKEVKGMGYEEKMQSYGSTILNENNWKEGKEIMEGNGRVLKHG